MPYQLPPIVKLAERLLVDVENAVQRFPRFHKYEAGSELRKQARMVLRLAHRAWRDRNGHGDWTGKLVWAMDDLKMELQLCLQLGAMRFAQFEHLGRIASELGKQIGGWNKQRQQLKGQNAAPLAASAAPQRAQRQLTSAPRARTFALKERKNSERSGIRTRQSRGFFVPGFSVPGGRRIQDPQGKEVRRLRSVLNLPASSRACVRTHPRGLYDLTQECSMANASDSQSAAPTTARTKFFQCDPDGTALFAVQRGIPVETALNEASTFLDIACALTYEAAIELDGDRSPDCRRIWAAGHLAAISKALVDSAINGMMRASAA